MFASHVLRCATLILLAKSSLVLGFTLPDCNNAAPAISPHETTQLWGSISKWNEEYKQSDDEDDEELITNEMFMRNMLAEPAKRKKKGSKEYKPHDNRDALPFVVKVKTPDPYTPETEMIKQAKKNSDTANAAKKKGNKKIKTINLVGELGSQGIAASIYSRKKDGTLYKVIGSFQFDKDTHCGDLVSMSAFYVLISHLASYISQHSLAFIIICNKI